MSLFRFVHAADLHIDSPLIGLAARSEALAELVDNASRKALDNLVSLATDEHCGFVVIAGDLFDGEWRDYRTGLFFVERMRLLREARIRVFIVLGNHDAENRFTRRLEFSDNVRVLSAQQAETVPLEDLSVAIHGQSFPRRDVTENLVANYPEPLSGFFNIGILHTACTGREGHQHYAPCSVEELLARGYDYWALGHVHKREILNQDPPIIFPGNLQGRHAQENGPKGAALVTVDDGRLTGIEHRPLDTVRWLDEQLDVRRCADGDAVLGEARTLLEQLVDSGDGRALALRLQICGETPLHEELVRKESLLAEEIHTIARDISSQIWIERIDLRTCVMRRAAADPTVAGRLQAIVGELSRSEEFGETMASIFGDVRGRSPHAAADDTFFTNIIERVRSHAAELAKAIAAGGEE